MTPQPPYFDQDSPFLKEDTRGKRWAIPYHYECLNGRVDTLLARQVDAVQDCRILDLACHMGTFAFAALQLGARFVHGVDTEPGMTAKGRELLQRSEIADSSYLIENKDVFEFLEQSGPDSFDTLFCFGMLYYTTEPLRLLTLMKKVAKRCILLDTFTARYAALQGKDAHQYFPHITDEMLDLPILLTSLTQSEKKDYRLPNSFKYKGKDLSLTTFPSRALLEIWFQTLEMDYTLLQWEDYIQKPCYWRDLWTPEQKQASHWADVYASEVRVAYRINL
ncbi:MAG: methyltransferase domain-containing protein [Nitrospinaceae bacterium]|nr:methyltransferase domain-containing protein [Nitrospinaceae bacterium]NIR55646.1 methyltransferase domain-containing protein [Nitrospinaceae bacterium]NIS86088.1 methyltransferase domain-containing protein [Nitrospinaceae bacterium]NIT82932.1 methyltransferase domain-containing protein [Nitrospinaceae bacterium]NIU45135.1 methyltransferase domain-containing protein [Nitrospinaceae bacterium]